MAKLTSKLNFGIIRKNKPMVDNKKHKPLSKIKSYALILLVLLLSFSFPLTVSADDFDEQIQAIENEVSGYQAEAGRLRSQADTLQNALNALTAQKNALQAQIDLNQAKYEKLAAEIAETEVRINNQKLALGQNLRSVYLESSISQLEMVASSRSISEFVDKQEYRNKIRDKIQGALKEIRILKDQLSAQKKDVEQILADQTKQREQLAVQSAEQASLLAQTQGQESAYQSIIGQKNASISSLRAQQIAANSRFIGGAGSGPACGGGYPARWCEIPMDAVVDNWGMYNRECVSYTAFKVAASGRHMPYWGGIGNANQWDDNARNQGIPVSSTPQAGDVGISNAGQYGHAIYVESVNSNGTINISQYNADWQGTYSTRSNISPAGLVFIHF